ncbi:hypothetical protein BC943DRAFT_320659 [Umbelopsis sp. AD052]|nr:hypothetical protein BC943DRAFT_320659 [Umbelopsis sp. AD052]
MYKVGREKRLLTFLFLISFYSQRGIPKSFKLKMLFFLVGLPLQMLKQVSHADR